MKDQADSMRTRDCPSGWEKRGVIEHGRTPPESAEDKTAAELEDHPRTRAARVVKEGLTSTKNKDDEARPPAS